MDTTFRPFALSAFTTALVVWDFPQPVRTAQIVTKGLLVLIVVLFFPINIKSAPQALTKDALCITISKGRSLYARTTISTLCFLIRFLISLSG